MTGSSGPPKPKIFTVSSFTEKRVDSDGGELRRPRTHHSSSEARRWRCLVQELSCHHPGLGPESPCRCGGSGSRAAWGQGRPLDLTSKLRMEP